MPQKKSERLSDILRQQILNGQIAPGNKLMSENELCAYYGMSRQVVRQAISILRKERLVESLQGSGTYVTNSLCNENTSYGVSVILPYDDDYIFGSFINGIHGTLSKNGYIVEMYISHNNQYEEEAAIASILNNPPAGIIIDPAKSICPRLHSDLYQKIYEKRIPCVSLNCKTPGFDFPVVAMNDVTAARIATKYLIARGHTKIGFLCNVDSAPGQLRLKGYMCEIGNANLNDETGHILYYSSEDEQELFSGMFDCFVLSKIKGCTAVVCFNDRVAVRLIHLLERHGIRVPDDISIIGHDGSLMSEYVTPKLTTVSHLKAELGMIAANNLIRLIKNPAFDATQIIEPEIIERDSVAFCNK